VQARHYNKHDYLREKRRLLESLYGLLNPVSEDSPAELEERLTKVVA